jgi:hypothetical protein
VLLFASILLWTVSIILAGLIGARKDATGLGIITGIILGPVGVLIMLATRGNLVSCPFCKEWIRYGALACSHCARELPKRQASVSLPLENAAIKEQLLQTSTVRGILLAIVAAITTYVVLWFVMR